MSREFIAASNESLVTTSTPVTAVPITIACWFRPTRSGSNEALAGIFDSGGNSDWMFLGLDTSGKVIANSRRSGQLIAVSSAAITINTWQHGIAEFGATNSRKAYLNGTNEGTKTGTHTPLGLDLIGIGRLMRPSPVYSYDGRIAEVGIWNVVLTTDEKLSLAAHVSPKLIRPQSLVFYLPLVRDDDQDLVGGLSLTAGGTPTVAVHPRVIMPASPLIVTAPTIAAGGGLSIPVAMHHYNQMRA